MQTRFHVTTPVVVKSAEEFAAIVQQNPIVPPEADHPRFLVAFAQGTAGRDTGTTMKDPPKPIDARAYSISSGLFAGAVVGTVSVSVDTKVNEATYGSGVSMLDILEGRAQEQPGMMRLERLLGGKSGS